MGAVFSWFFAARRRSALLVVLAVSGCGAEVPPYDDLPLRDTLRAAPAVLAALPQETRADMASRFEEAHLRGDAEDTAVVELQDKTLAAIVRSADAARESEGLDAVVLGAIAPSEGGLVLRAMTIDGAPDERPGERPALVGRPDPATAALEEAALRGRAGTLLRELRGRAEARVMVRTTGLPVGVVVMDQALFVNASWLVVLSALEPEAAGGSRTAGRVGEPAKDVFAPQSVGHNPYDLPASVEACANEVRDVCSCAPSGTCDHEPTDKTFSDAQAECAWVNAALEHAAALCVLALLDIAGVKECVASAGAACTRLPVRSRDDALAFAADASCLSVLDLCLDGGDPRPPSSGEVTRTSDRGCGCNDDADSCNDSCARCNDNWADCNDNYEDCRDDCRGDGGGSSVTAMIGGSRCSLRGDGRRDGGDSPAGAPFGTILCMVAPLGYALFRARRQA